VHIQSGITELNRQTKEYAPNATINTDKDYLHYIQNQTSHYNVRHVFLLVAAETHLVHEYSLCSPNCSWLEWYGDNLLPRIPVNTSHKDNREYHELFWYQQLLLR